MLTAILQGSVPVPAFDRPVLLIGRENMNRAVQGDVVAVEVFDEKDWKAPGDEVVDQESLSRTPVRDYRPAYRSIATLKNDDAEDSEEEGEGDEAAAERKVLHVDATKQASSKQPTGRIVGIIKRNWRSSVCIAVLRA